MRLRKGKSVYPMPPHSAVQQAFVDDRERDPSGACYALYFVPHEAISIPGEKPGRPQRFSLHADKIAFGPPPDGPYNVRVQYAPPIKEI